MKRESGGGGERGDERAEEVETERTREKEKAAKGERVRKR